MKKRKEIAWPPPYTLRRSRRARSLRIGFDRNHQLEVVYPYFVTKRSAINFLNQHRSWVERQLGEMKNRVKTKALPLRIKLLAIDQQRYVDYESTASSVVMIKDNGERVRVSGCVANEDAVRLALRRLVARKAKQHLTEMLDHQVKLTGIGYQKVSYRAQHSLWGSCSQSGNISLNMKLLFLPSEWAKYVMLHELCHRRHFNHSRQFWTLVAGFQRNYKEIERQMNAADVYIPGWFV